MQGRKTRDDIDLAEAMSAVGLVRYDAGHAVAERDLVAREEPLEIQVRGATVAVTMRTPGHDEELVRGFLVTERVVRRAGDIAAVRHCSVAPDADAAGNVVNVILRAGVRVDLAQLRRNLFASSSCGVCGKATIDNALAVAPPLEDDACVDPAVFHGLTDRLAAEQSVFARTGGLHAAALIAPRGALLVTREDVGRHNAVDKVVGWALARNRTPLRGHLLLVSGRISFEIVQKALAARVPVIAAVSAPTSLAIDLAQRAGLMLVGFLRGQRFNVYGHDRLRKSPRGTIRRRGDPRSAHRAQKRP